MYRFFYHKNLKILVLLCWIQSQNIGIYILNFIR